MNIAAGRKTGAGLARWRDERPEGHGRKLTTKDDWMGDADEFHA